MGKFRRKVRVYGALIMRPPPQRQQETVTPVHMCPLAAHHRPTVGPVLAPPSVYVCTPSSDPGHELLAAGLV